MSFSFKESDVAHIAEVLGVEPKIDGSLARYELSHKSSGRRVTLEIQTDLRLPDSIGTDMPNNLVSVYATNSFLQLQGCTGYLASKDLGEVIFVAKSGNAANGLVVEREAGCSLYANVDMNLFSTDFTQLPPELIMSSVALSATEEFFDDLG